MLCKSQAFLRDSAKKCAEIAVDEIRNAFEAGEGFKALNADEYLKQNGLI